jgi:hypothetical protein
MRYVQILILLLLSTYSYSQEQQWVDAATYGSGRLSYMEPDRKGNYILAGYFGSQIDNQIFKFPDRDMPSQERGNIVILKVDSLFDIISYNYITGVKGAFLQGMQVVNDHVFVNFSAGINSVSSTKNGTFPPTQRYEDIITCFDSELSLLWSKHAIDSVNSTTDLKFCGTLENKVVVSGNISDEDSERKSSSYIDSTVIRSPDRHGRTFYFLIDSVGAISDLTYISKYDNARIQSFKKYNNDNYLTVYGLGNKVVVNEELVYTGPIVPKIGSHTSLVKMDSSKQVKWLQIIGLDGWGYAGAFAIDVDVDENVLLAVNYATLYSSGSSDNRPNLLYVGDSFIAREDRLREESSNVALALMNDKGEVQWLKKLWSYGGQRGVSTVICRSENSYLIFGETSQQLVYDGDTLKSTYSDGTTAFILELDSNGNKLSFEMLGDNGSTFSSKMILEENEDLVIAGNTYSGRVAFGDYKIEPEDVTDPSTFFNFYIARKSIRTRGSIPTEKIDNDVTIYPNPANGYFKVDFQQDSGSKELYVYDPLGREVLYQMTEEENLVVNVSGLASGSYIVNISTSTGSYTKKLLISKW